MQKVIVVLEWVVEDPATGKRIGAKRLQNRIMQSLTRKDTTALGTNEQHLHSDGIKGKSIGVLSIAERRY